METQEVEARRIAAFMMLLVLGQIAIALFGYMHLENIGHPRPFEWWVVFLVEGTVAVLVYQHIINRYIPNKPLAEFIGQEVRLTLAVLPFTLVMVLTYVFFLLSSR